MVFVLGKTENSSLDQSQPVFVAYDSFSMRVHILYLKCADIIVPIVFVMQYYDSIWIISAFYIIGKFNSVPMPERSCL